MRGEAIDSKRGGLVRCLPASACGEDGPAREARMLTTHDPITTRDHLIDLARVLTEADGQDPPDPARVGQLAWQILAELNEAAFGRIDAEALLAQAQTAARGRR